ncbi:cobaltochelatase subunit CobN [Ketobacter alkanivorans]|uniref:Cobalamin biosynthesis protein CobN n=1 Tax=Ketobacter alkanivorans TaxID=1917421 RepID=A0A2K9LJR5_9GAMM|nr:cobaltochelatase subunit CobN [Ketobacter alkanivorans]AUM12522.1 cobalamin biosynthesis protein CobN [Ketobacter alkanivorans]
MRVVLYVLTATLCSIHSNWLLAASSDMRILMLVSQRNAETVAEAGHRFLKSNPNFRLQARTETQLLELSSKQRQELLESADVVVGAGLFGAVVSELVADLSQSRNIKNVLVFNSDHRLVRLSRHDGVQVFNDDKQVETLSAMRPEQELAIWLESMLDQYPAQAPWLIARSYWQGGGEENLQQLFVWVAQQYDLESKLVVKDAIAQARLRWWFRGELSEEVPAIDNDKPLVVVLDHAGGDRPGDAYLLNQLCAVAEQKHQQCLVGLAYWGDATVDALEKLRTQANNLTAVVMLQDFVMGGGEGRERANEQLALLNVPVLKAIKLRDRTAAQWRLSSDGLAVEKVYYQISMPEMQGASQPLVVASAGAVTEDVQTGIRIQPIEPVLEGMETLMDRVQRWHSLQTQPNAEKRIAIVYYNHPPGRHNIGADNLDVPATLWQILNQMKSAGYRVSDLPASQNALLDAMQESGVNLPNDHAALVKMSHSVMRMDATQYQSYFDTLPEVVKREMVDGPFGLLHGQLQVALAAGLPKMAQATLDHTMEEMLHLLEGVDHQGRQRALDLLGQLQACYQGCIDQSDQACWQQSDKIVAALKKTGIEGLGGWGSAPGKVMVHDGQLLMPGLQFGNVFIGPQPPRGWEINEELLHANLAFPPPHQYLAYYHYLRDVFKADAIVHVGRHSTYEFLPRRSVGLAEDDYARIVAADVPGLYPYIVDGVGEGIQAKRRGLAVMIDHLTPPLQSTPLYDELLKLRQLIESFEANHNSDNPALTQRLVTQIREKVDALELKDELAEAMSAELSVMGISFNEVDDDMLVHEVGHYLTNLQERFMPLGLHVFGRDWAAPAVEMMLSSMAPENELQKAQWQALLEQSPQFEMSALLNGLNGRYVLPGKGNDPIRSPESLPTGRNFYALDNSLIPSPVAWQLGREMARDARANNAQNSDKREAQVLWASDVVRDEGVMIAFALDMLGLEPVWNSRGLVKGLKLQALGGNRVRRDMVFTTSGLFRDLYGQQMKMLDRGVLMALSASADRIVAEHPALVESLQLALAPLGGSLAGGNESLQQNQVAGHWVKDARRLLAQGRSPEQVALLSSLRVFGDAPGSYGAGINRLVERSGAWQQRQELAEVYIRRLGHGFNQDQFGASAQETFKTLLADVENTYFGRSSNLYGLIDNNDAFDYLGGLSLAVETLTGTAPNNYVLNHADPERVVTQPLGLALRQELRGRFLNPKWLTGLMDHGYAGARTMGSEFLEYLWGWQVTNPTLVGDWAWQEVKEVYLDDRYGLGVNTFLEVEHNAHVKANMLAIMLVAVHKQFWQADEQTIQQLAQDFTRLVIENGLPGSGHTDPNHPMMPWLEQFVSAEQWQQFAPILDAAATPEEVGEEVHRLTEIKLVNDPVVDDITSKADLSVDSNEQLPPDRYVQLAYLALVILMISVVVAGFRRSWRGHSY